MQSLQEATLRVAPFTGAWIEIFVTGQQPVTIGSLPSRERGLKSFLYVLSILSVVAPFTGAWIEISSTDRIGPIHRRRSLHGSVD